MHGVQDGIPLAHPKAHCRHQWPQSIRRWAAVVRQCGDAANCRAQRVGVTTAVQMGSSMCSAPGSHTSLHPVAAPSPIIPDPAVLVLHAQPGDAVRHHLLLKCGG